MIKCNQSRARQSGQANTQARQVKLRHGTLDARMPADNYAMWPCQSTIADPEYNGERRLRVGVRPTRRRHDPEDSSGTRLLTSCASARVLPTSGLAAAHVWTLELGQAQWAPAGDRASLLWNREAAGKPTCRGTKWEIRIAACTGQCCVRLASRSAALEASDRGDLARGVHSSCACTAASIARVAQHCGWEQAVGQGTWIAAEATRIVFTVRRQHPNR